jgi:hypothetical protein
MSRTPSRIFLLREAGHSARTDLTFFAFATALLFREGVAHGTKSFSPSRLFSLGSKGGISPATKRAHARSNESTVTKSSLPGRPGLITTNQRLAAIGSRRVAIIRCSSFGAFSDFIISFRVMAKA